MSLHEDLRITESLGGPPRPPVYRNPEHKVRIAEWIERHWDHGPCPVCKSNNFSTGAVHEIPAFAPAVGPVRAMVPVFPVICNTCGYIIWINAIVAKVVRPEEERLQTFDQWDTGA